MTVEIIEPAAHDDEVVGGFSLLKDATAEISVVQPIAVPNPSVNVVERVCLRIALAAIRTIRRLKAAFAALMRDVHDVAEHLRVVGKSIAKAHAYRPRHKAARVWYGRQRSTSERCRANAQVCRDAAKEGELSEPPREFVSWMINVIETLREEYDVMHRPQGRHFICS